MKPITSDLFEEKARAITLENAFIRKWFIREDQ